jgi:hypothetical protein
LPFDPTEPAEKNTVASDVHPTTPISLEISTRAISKTGDLAFSVTYAKAEFSRRPN